MTNLTDQQRCDGLVEAGIVYWIEPEPDEDQDGPRFLSLVGERRCILLNEDYDMQCFMAAKDPRVAMECLKELRRRGYSWLLVSMPDGKAVMTVTSPMPERTEWDAQIVDDCDERAIVDAYLESVK